MRLVALYKTWDGGEFIDASLLSVYDRVDAVVMVHSETSWLGEPGNTVKPLAIAWCEQYDKIGKVHHIDVNLTSQEAQYAAGVDYIERHKLGDVVMVVDSDEVWESQYIENARRQIADKPYPAYRIGMHTYLKSPFYRVDPPFGSPVAFLRDPHLLTKSPRGCHAPSMHLPDVWMHHYTAVRASRAAVERKIHQSCLADGGEQVIPDWMSNVYDQLPEGHNLHYFVRHRAVWQRVVKVTVAELPAAMLQAKLLPAWYSLVPAPVVAPTPSQHTLFMQEAAKIRDVAKRHAFVFDSGESSPDFYNVGKRLASEEFAVLRSRITHTDSLIEVGCYTGLNLIALCKAGHTGHLTGLDFVQGAVDWLRANWPGHPDSLKTVCTTFPAGFPAGPIYDVATCFDVLEHQRDVGTFLEGISSVLKPGGKALFLVPARKEYYDCGHVAFFPDAECLTNTLNYTFDVEECFELASCNKLFATCKRRNA